MRDGILRHRRWTRREYERLIALGLLPEGEPVELLGGALVLGEAQSPLHYTAVRTVAAALRVAFGPGWDVRERAPIALDDDSAPEPDVAVVGGEPLDYRDAHPSRPALIAEIALSTLATDRHVKGGLYARAGIAEYWLVNLPDRRLEVHREPGPDARAPYGASYGLTLTLGAPDHVRPRAAPAATLLVADLLL